MGARWKSGIPFVVGFDESLKLKRMDIVDVKIESNSNGNPYLLLITHPLLIKYGLGNEKKKSLPLLIKYPELFPC